MKINMATVQLTIPKNISTHNKSGQKRFGLSLFSIGMFFLLLSFTAATKLSPILFFFLSVGLTSVGGLVYWFAQYKESPSGVKKNHMQFLSVASRGWLGWMLGIFFTLFYIFLYWFPEMLANLIPITDWLSYIFRGKPSDQWFLYGTFYSVTVLIMGIRMIIHNRHNRYQILRTCSVIFF